MRKFSCFFIVILLYFDNLPQCNLTGCGESPFIGNVVKWDYSNKDFSSVSSTPICLDNNKTIVKRFCKKSVWESRVLPTCNYIQKEQSYVNSCPMNFVKVLHGNSYICVLFTEPRSWNNSCIYYGSSTSLLDLGNSEFTTIIQYLIQNNQTRFWLSAQRTSSFERIVWKLPSPKWHEYINIGRFIGRTKDSKISTFNDTFNGNCLSLEIATFRRVASMENCENKYPEVCIFKGAPLMKLACPNGSYTSRFGKYQDICIKTEIYANQNKTPEVSNCDNLFSATSPEKLYLLENSVKSQTKQLHCSANFIPNKITKSKIFNRFEWNFNNKENFTNWDRESNVLPAPSQKQYSSLLMTNYKWVVLEQNPQCDICENRLKIQEPKFYLTFIESINKLFLTVYSGNYLWKEDNATYGFQCFTDATNFLQPVVIQNRIYSVFMESGQLTGDNNSNNTVLKELYRLDVYTDSPANYWCEGFGISTLKLIKSEKIVGFSRHSGSTFAILLSANCYDCTLDEGESYAIDILTNVVERITNATNNIYKESKLKSNSMRVMKINSIDQNEKQFKFFLHINVSPNENFKPNYLNNTDKIFVEMKALQENTEILVKQHITNASEKYNVKFISARSIEYCLPESLNSWKMARIGEISTLAKLCLTKEGSMITRKCIGDPVYGASWETLQDAECREDAHIKSDVTNTLYNIESAEDIVTTEVVEQVRDIFNKPTELLPADLFFVGKIMNKVVTATFEDNSTDTNDKETMGNIMDLYDHILLINDSMASVSQTNLNTTNILLDAYSSVINKYAESETLKNDLKKYDDGTFLNVKPNLLLFIADPTLKNISGIALIRDRTKKIPSHDFSDFIVNKLYINGSKDILNDEELEVASYIPEEVLLKMNQTLKGTNEIPRRIIFTIYYKDTLFQESIVRRKLGDRIVVSISIPKYSADLPGSVPIYFREKIVTKRSIYNQTSINKCEEWNSSPNKWTSNNCDYKYYEGKAVCICSRLANFGFVKMFGKHNNSNKVHAFPLLIITYAGIALSLFGIFGIYLAAILIQKFRQFEDTVILLNEATAIGLQLILYMVSENAVPQCVINNQTKCWNCIILGAFLAYSVLVASLWTLIFSIRQYYRNAKLVEEWIHNMALKFGIIGWGIPLIPIILSVIFGHKHYVKNPDFYFCYPTGIILNLTVLLPIAIIIIFNLLILMNILYVYYRSDKFVKRSSMNINNLKLLIFLLFLFGISWSFGFAAKYSIIFSYIFCITATTQGFSIFIFGVLLRPNIWKLWKEQCDRADKKSKIEKELAKNPLFVRRTYVNVKIK